MDCSLGAAKKEELKFVPVTINPYIFPTKILKLGDRKEITLDHDGCVVCGSWMIHIRGT